MGLKNGKVILKNDYLNWLKMFNEEKQILKDLLGEIAITIEHIGSTSIEGLSPKPIVDIAVGVKDLKDIEQVKPQLNSIYTIKYNIDSEEILLIKEESEVTYFLIHIMKVDSRRYKSAIAFRDYIRSNPESLKQYEQLKIQLAKKYSDDRKMYTQAKNNFIKEILENEISNDMYFKIKGDSIGDITF